MTATRGNIARVIRRTMGLLSLFLVCLFVVVQFAPVRGFVLKTNQSTYELFVGGQLCDFSIYQKAPAATDSASACKLTYRPPLDPNPPPVMINGRACCASPPYHRRSIPAHLLSTQRYLFSPWWPTGLPLGFGVALLISGRSRRLTGHCLCGYNLTGNVSGVCPECGRPVDSRERLVREPSG